MVHRNYELVIDFMMDWSGAPWWMSMMCHVIGENSLVEDGCWQNQPDDLIRCAGFGIWLESFLTTPLYLERCVFRSPTSRLREIASCCELASLLQQVVAITTSFIIISRPSWCSAPESLESFLYVCHTLIELRVEEKNHGCSFGISSFHDVEELATDRASNTLST